MTLMGIKPITSPSTMLLQGNEVPFKLEFQIFGTKKKKKKLENYFQNTNYWKKTISLEIFYNETISARNMFDVEKSRAQRQGIWRWKAWPDSLSHLIIQIYTTLNFSCMLKKNKIKSQCPEPPQPFTGYPGSTKFLYLVSSVPTLLHFKQNALKNQLI